MKLQKYKKNDLEFVIGIIIFNMIILGNFLNMHYATDTYCVIESGFGYIAKNAFLWSGRPITAGVFYLADFFNVSMSTHILIMACISIMTLSLSVYILFRTIINLNITREKTIITIVIMLSYITVINFCTIDFLVFSEMGILCTGLLFSVMSACEFAKDSRFKYCKIVLFAIIGVLCYQAVLNIYVPLALMIIAIRYKDDIRKAFLKAFFVLVIYGIAIVFSMIMSNIINSVINLGGRQTIVPDIAHIFKTYGKYLKFMVIDTLDVGQKYWYILVISIITFIYFIYNFISKSKWINLVYYVSILLSSILIPTLPLIVQPAENQYLELRMILSFGSSIGIMLLYTVCSIRKEYEKTFKLILIISVLLFISNGQYIVRSSGEMIGTNLLDRNYADAILNKIEKYEKDNNMEVRNIAIDYDTSLEFYYHGSKIYRCLNAKALATDWAITGVLRTYGNREFTRVEVSQNIHDQYFKGRNWTSFDEEQLVFEGDTLYICIY